MKKLLLLGIFMMSLGMSAQIDWSSTRFGVIGGGNYSRIRNAHNPSGPRYTFQAGALALIPIGSEEQFYLQPEITYYGAGESGKQKDAKGHDGYNAIYANDYLSVPIFFKGYFSENETEFFGFAGPRFNFLIRQKTTDAPASRPYYTPDVTDPLHPEISGNANKFNFGASFGLGYSYKRQLELAVSYNLGISNTYPKLKEGWTGDPSTDLSKSEQVLSVTLSYIFK